MELDWIDQGLLNTIQRDFPITERPFREIGTAVGIAEGEVLERLGRLVEAGVVRFVGAIINTVSLGFKSALVSFMVEECKIGQAADVVSSHPGVTHNYERNDPYNLWFTVAVPGDIDLKGTVERLFRISGAKRYLFLPALKVYKIGVVLDASGGGGRVNSIKVMKNGIPIKETSKKKNTFPGHEGVTFTNLEKEVLMQVQNTMPLLPEPFTPLAENARCTPDQFIHLVKELMAKGIIRRFGAVPNHRKIGYTYNTMAVWEIPRGSIDDCGRKIASYNAITHCYHRACSPEWPYSLYSMLHCRSEEECDRIVEDIVKVTGCMHYRLLSTVREYKKSRLRYFSEEFYRWEREHGPALFDFP